MDNRLGIAPGAEVVAFLHQLFAQRLIVPDLAVKGEPDLAGFVGQGLMSPTQVDDTEADHPQSDVPIDIDPAVIGAPMSDQARHLLDELW